MTLVHNEYIYEYIWCMLWHHWCIWEYIWYIWCNKSIYEYMWYVYCALHSVQCALWVYAFVCIWCTMSICICMYMVHYEYMYLYVYGALWVYGQQAWICWHADRRWDPISPEYSGILQQTNQRPWSCNPIGKRNKRVLIFNLYYWAAWTGWLVGSRLPKGRATSRYAHPPLFLQLSNPLPNSPGTPTHLGQPPWPA